MPIGIIGCFDRPDIYKQLIVAEMKRQGADQSAIDILTDEIVWMAFKERVYPEDMAWGAMAVLQDTKDTFDKEVNYGH